MSSINKITSKNIAAWKLFLTPRMIIVFLLGFSSGLPSELTRTALQAWFTVSGVSIVSIGLLGFVAFPYAYKFIWAPLMDRYLPPFLGRRTGWLLICQIALIISIIVMAFFNPKVHALTLGILALIVAFISASQDISIDAYRTDLLTPAERGPGTAINVAGYRIAMIISGGLALILAQEIGWRDTYIIMGVLMLIGVFATFLAPEPYYEAKPPSTMKAAVIEPFKEFLSRDYAVALLIFIIIYKLSYAFILVMSPSFLLRGLDFSLIDVGTVNKGIGLFATIIGVFLGGIATTRLGIFRALFSFGILQACSNLIFVVLAIVGKNYLLMVLAVFIVNFFAGMEAATFVAFLMKLCDHRYTATQYALLSALAMIGNAIVAPISGILIEGFGWADFYVITFLVAIPALVVLWFLRKTSYFQFENQESIEQTEIAVNIKPQISPE